jgi:hypothetical protein
MKCIYCGQPCNDDMYGRNANYEEYDIEVSGLETTVHIHDKCLPKILSEWIRNKIHPVIYGAPYDCAPKVTCDTVDWMNHPSHTKESE